MVQIGDPVPDHEVVNQDGKPVRLTDFAGKRVILFAYPRAGTPGCTTQACGFRDIFPRFAATDVVVLGISADKPKDNLKWKQKEKLPYDLLSDETHTLLESLGAWGEKSLYGKKYMGITRSHWVIGPDGRFEDVQIGVSPKDSVALAEKKTLG
jgi:peroxiredoxin Q/BCP